MDLSLNRRMVLSAAPAFLAACATPNPHQANQHLASTESAMIEGVTMKMVETNGVRLRVAEAGKGPLVVLVHGWPESWYSWRHQIPALTAAGYRVIAPDMRGYGKSDKPAAVEDYDIHHLTADIAGLIEASGETSAIIVGHDWGSIVTWHMPLLHPARVRAIATMSVPFGGRGGGRPTETMQKAFGDNFYYMLYHQERDAAGRGAAETEYDADPRGLLSRLYASPDAEREAPLVTDPKRAAGGWIPRLGKPKALPSWLTQADLDYIVGEFRDAGFRGGVNYYRNLDRNWETTTQIDGAKISVPVMFLAGEGDIVIRGAKAEQLTATMSRVATDLRGVTLIPGAGHWIQQEKPAETNALLLGFLKGIRA
jgi:pimeloyl-ACP methyl ester carboxylesterase